MSWKSVVRFPGILGTIAFAFYLAWNIRWLVRGMVPPSILLGVFGVPAPTTGMTRSTLAFLDGDWGNAFLWNPFTLPCWVILGWTAFEISSQLLAKRRLVLSRPLALAWTILLSAAWITKLVMGSQWW